jgi:hypothetical protein
MTRREVLALLGALVPMACGGRPTTPPEAPHVPALRLDPVVDLVPAAGLVWLIQARAAELLTDRGLAPAVALVLPSARLDGFAETHGGLDLRRTSQLVVAGYGETFLALARTPSQPGRVEAAFAGRALDVEGRAVEGGVTRFWGSIGGDREQVALFGTEAVALERGHLGPLRAVIYFAQGKLKRALPALHAEPLARPAELLGDAPLRAFAPGPFTGEWAAGLGGLLRAATALAAAVEPLQRPSGLALRARVVLSGAWGSDAPSAAERLGAAFQVLANDPLGRLMGIDHPLEEPRVSGNAEALHLEVLLDPGPLARGIHAATDAKMSEVMGY